MSSVPFKMNSLIEEEEDSSAFGSTSNVQLDSSTLLRNETKTGAPLPNIVGPKRNPRAGSSYDNFSYDPIHDDLDFFDVSNSPPATINYDPTVKSEADDEKSKLPPVEDWDQFETLPLPDEDETLNSKWVDISIKWLKIIAYIFTFLVVLSTAVLSKSITLLMTSMIKPNHTVTVCNSDNFYKVHKQLEHDKNYIVRYESTGVHRIAWLWGLYFAIIAPYIFSFGRSLRICYFKTFEVPKLMTWITVFMFETAHCIGLAILCFAVLPYTEATLGAMMMNAVCTVPTLIRLMVRRKHESFPDSHTIIATSRLFSYTGFVFQILSLVSWTTVGYFQDHPYYYLIPISLILVSSEWWENYVVRDRMNFVAKFLDNARDNLHKTRYFISCFVMPYKVLLLLGLLYLHEIFLNGIDSGSGLFRNFIDSFQADTIPVIRNKGDNFLLAAERHQLFVYSAFWPLWFLLIHILLNYICYAFGKFTCKICIQGFSFAVPISITVPVTVSALWAMTNLSFQDKCQLLEVFHPFQYIFWTVVNEKKFEYSADNSHGWKNIIVSVIWLFGLITQFATTIHIWKETSESLASTEQLFVSPMYNGVLIDQSLAMNRRTVKETYSGDEENIQAEQDKPQTGSFGNSISRNNPLYRSDGGWEDKRINIEFSDSGVPFLGGVDDKEDHEWLMEWARVSEEQGVEIDSIDAKPNPIEDDTVRIYACATMWHEDRNEMLQMLKAVMRLDYDQAVQRIAKEKFNDSSKYFELEVNIFFDDAYEQGDTNEEDDRVVNRFVDQLMDVMKESATQVTGKNNIIEMPIIVPTPYGGKLIWKMPTGENRLIAHVKDKNLIRHRKRWSQVMYMYYLLGYRLNARRDIDKVRENKIANNMFVLALDGDINFQPSAVHMVVDLMKKNHKLGAACGRIHPIGSGPMVWYQKFEYAIGHWLQKATEHVFGCVLCSPGCFSLFRARAIMAKSVMHKYTTKPQEAIHYVQYDQGEDRWLCTLMLQQGWRIEYSAASDSYTHAPESFGEFYTQRRRWAPSTTANIIDLLQNYKETVRRNDNISLIYIAYQFCLMMGTVLSPGTIFLMIVSAMNTALNFDSQTSFIINLVPILVFIFVCLKFEDNNIKINLAFFLSIIYSLLMLAVLVGTGIDMFQQGILSPNALFFSAMMGSFLVAAFLHPQEFFCVAPLPVYMLLIPSMYLLLTIYSVTNMHIVSWGTREVKSKLSEKEILQQELEKEAKAKAEAAKKSSGGLLSFISLKNVSSAKNGLFTCMCCTGDQHDDTTALVEIRENILEVKSAVNDIHNQFPRQRGSSFKKNQVVTEEPRSPSIHNNGNESEEPKSLEMSEHENNLPSGDQDSIPKWILNHPILKTLKRRFIPEKEKIFWNKMITKYLLPLDENLEEKERISNELQELRNKVCFAFGFINVIFVLFVFLLQIHKDVFGINIPVSWNTTIVYDEDLEKYVSEEGDTKYTRMDPIGLVLVVFFGSILIVQCLGMFIHRFGTLAHLLAYTQIDFFVKNKDVLFDPSKFIKKIIKFDEKVKKQEEEAQNPSNRGGSGVRSNDPDVSPDVQVEKKKVRIDDVFQNRIDKIMVSDGREFKKMSVLMRKNTINALNRQDTRRRRTTSFNNSDTLNTLASISSGVDGPRRRIMPTLKTTFEDTSSLPMTPGISTPEGFGGPPTLLNKFQIRKASKEEISLRSNSSKKQPPNPDFETTRL